jgi:uncharacterized protein (TIGR03083 family)
MSDKKADIQAKLSATRQVLQALIEGVSDEQWATAVYADNSDWTIADLFRHVVDSERSMTALMAQIQGGGEGVPADFDLARWNARGINKAKEKTTAELIADSRQNRAALLAFINSLAETDWDKKGRHGSLRIMSIEEICHLIADHEAGHTEEIRRALALI